MTFPSPMRSSSFSGHLQCQSGIEWVSAIDCFIDLPAIGFILLCYQTSSRKGAEDATRKKRILGSRPSAFPRDGLEQAVVGTGLPRYGAGQAMVGTTRLFRT